jgi:hypothetical protein
MRNFVHAIHCEVSAPYWKPTVFAAYRDGKVRQYQKKASCQVHAPGTSIRCPDHQVANTTTVTLCFALFCWYIRFSRSGTYYAPNPPADDSVDEMQHMVQYIRGLPYSEGPEVCMHAATALVLHYIRHALHALHYAIQ